jgi:hypothetical protein
MFSILNNHYQKKSGQPIQLADLGHSTENFNFFVTQSISRTLTLTSGGSSAEQGLTLMNKLITLTSEGKYSLIDTVVEKLVKKGDEVKSDSRSNIGMKIKDSHLVNPIEEEDEFNEEEALDEIKQEEDKFNAENGVADEEEVKDN